MLSYSDKVQPQRLSDRLHKGYMSMFMGCFTVRDIREGDGVR